MNRSLPRIGLLSPLVLLIPLLAAAPGASPAPDGTAVPPVLDVEAFDDGGTFRLRLSRDAVDPGPLRVRYWNNGTVGHDLHAPGLGIDVPCCVAPGRMVERVVEVPDRPGEHRLLCRPHEALGMETTLRVTGDRSTPGAAPLLPVLIGAALAVLARDRTRPPPATKPL